MKYKIWDIVEVRVYPLDHVFSNAIESVWMITWYQLRNKGTDYETYMYFVNWQYEWDWRMKPLESK
jgi:hypothetical protein